MRPAWVCPLVLLLALQCTAQQEATEADWIANTRAQAHECQEQLLQLAKTRNPASVFPPGASDTMWSMAEQRRNDLVAALNKWHAEHGNNVDEGHSGQVNAQQQFYLALAQIPCVRTVCEIGFNGGHSTAVWLAARDDIRVISFDLGSHAYAFSALQFFTTIYPGRITSTFGDSTKTVPLLASKMGRVCDLLVVDGGHDYEVAIADVMNMAKLANPHFNIFVIDDVNCAPFWCVGPDKATQEAIDKKVLVLDFKFAYRLDGSEVADAQQKGDRGFSFGSYLVTESTRTKHHRWWFP